MSPISQRLLNTGLSQPCRPPPRGRKKEHKLEDSVCQGISAPLLCSRGRLRQCSELVAREKRCNARKCCKSNATGAAKRPRPSHSEDDSSLLDVDPTVATSPSFYSKSAAYEKPRNSSCIACERTARNVSIYLVKRRAAQRTHT
jgi:hypothetical protein